MKLKFFCYLLLIFSIVSCSGNEFEEITQIEQNDSLYTLNIFYKDKMYCVQCKTNENDDVVYLNSEFDSIYRNEISVNQNLAMFLVGEDSIVYYDSVDELLDSLNKTVVNSAFTEEIIQTRAPSLSDTLAYAKLWDDTGFKDRSIDFKISTQWMQLTAYHNKLKNYSNFNDKTSAFKIWNYLPETGSVKLPNVKDAPWFIDPRVETVFYTVSVDVNLLDVIFLGYEDSDFKGKVLCCIPPHGGKEYSHRRLKDIGWNDKFSSIKLMLLYGNDRNAFSSHN